MWRSNRVRSKYGGTPRWLSKQSARRPATCRLIDGSKDLLHVRVRLGRYTPDGRGRHVPAGGPATAVDELCVGQLGDLVVRQPEGFRHRSTETVDRFESAEARRS